jgi:non-homologous end joining protein Ku
MNHHEELGNQHRKLLKQLELAKQFMEKKRKHWKANTTSDNARFAFQNAIGLVNQLE